MKSKVLSLFLILSLVMSFFTFPVIANAKDFSCTQSIQEYEISGTTLSVTVKVSNSGSSRAYANGYVAVYTSSGELKGTKTGNLSVAKNNSTTITYPIKNYKYASGDYVKCFLWDDNLSPMAEPVTATVIDGEEIEGIILETYLSDPDYSQDENTVTMIVTKSSSSSYSAGNLYTFAADNTTAPTYLGFTVAATVGKNSNGDDAIFDITEKDNSNNLYIIDMDLVDEITEDMIAYYETDYSKTTTEAEIEPFATINGEYIEFDNIVVNGFNVNYDPIDYFFDEIVYQLDEIYLLDNDNDGAFEFIYATVPVDPVEFVAEEIEVEDGLYWFEGEFGSIEIDTTDPDIIYTIIKDGVISTPDAINIGDTITCLDESVNVLTIFVSSVTVTGTIEEIDDDIHYINGTPYRLSPLFEEDFRAGDEGTFYINAAGQIAYVFVPQPALKYYYIVDADVSSGDFGGNSYIVKAVNTSGTEQILTIQNKKVIVYSEDYHETLSAEYVYADYIDGYTGLVMLRLNKTGEISEIYFPDSVDEFASIDRYINDAVNQTKTYNKARCIYGAVELSEDTLIFNIDNDNAQIRTSTVGEVFVNGCSYSFIAYGEYEGISDVLVTFDIEMPEGDTDDTEPSVSKSEYVYMVDFDSVTGNFGEEVFYVKAVTTSGETKVYAINSKNVDVYTQGGVESSLTAEEAFVIICDYYDIVKITLTENDSIADFYLSGCDEFISNDRYSDDAELKTKSYNAQTLTYGTISIDSETILYSIDTSNDDLEDSISTGKAVDMLKNGSSYSFIAYGKNGEPADIIVALDVELPFDPDAPVMVVTKVSLVVNNRETLRIQGVQNGATVSVILNPNEYKMVDVEKGNVIMYTLLDGYATNVQVLFNSTAEEIGSLSENLNNVIANEFSDEAVTIHYGTITDKTTSTVTINNDKFYYADTMNIIVVDYSYNTVSIKSGTWSDVKASNAKYTRTAFIKTLPYEEDEIADIVVFITPAE